jgi:hypothetical protein
MRITVKYQIDIKENSVLRSILTDGTTFNAEEYLEYLPENRAIYTLNMTNGLGSRELMLIGTCTIFNDREILLQILKDSKVDVLYLVNQYELDTLFTKE